MSGMPLLGILLGLVVESANWIKSRWDFSTETTNRAWQFNVLVIGLATVWVFLIETPYLALPILIAWLPALLLPMQLIQSFGLIASLPLSTFSFLAKNRQERNLRLGLKDPTLQINFGNIYFIGTIIAASLGSETNALPYSRAFLPCLVVLAGWRLLSSSGSRPLSLLIALTFSGGIALVGQIGLDELSNWLGNRGSSRPVFNPNSAATSIGRLGPIDLSPDIMWRLRTSENSRKPNLLRTGTYNTFYGSTWQNARVTDKDFRDLDNIEPRDGEIYFLLNDNLTPDAQKKAIGANLPRYTIYGTASAETPLPLPGDTTSLRDFELDGVDCNSFGTVRIFPKHSIIQGTVIWQGKTNPESPPILKEDLVIPQIDSEVLQKILKEIRIDEQPTLQAKLAAIRSWFQKNFKYSRTLLISSFNQPNEYRSAIHKFLTSVRSGHCEYFATSAALLLRQAGIPTRYAIGYAVMEFDSTHEEYVIRGTHSHAWCRVWDADQSHWIDFDPTPGSLFANTSMTSSRAQRISDYQKRLREDFFLWRNKPNNRMIVSVVMSMLALGVLIFIAKKLSKSKRHEAKARLLSIYQEQVIHTSLNALEPLAEKRLGSRPLSEPLGSWLKRLRPWLGGSSTLDEAILLHQRLRFDPSPHSQIESERLTELTKVLESKLKRN